MTRRTHSWVQLSAVALVLPLLGGVAGCGDSTITSSDAGDASSPPADTALDTTPDAADVSLRPDVSNERCTLPSGGTCAVGMTCPAGDGCNDCTCAAGARLMCTARPCAAGRGGGGRRA